MFRRLIQIFTGHSTLVSKRAAGDYGMHREGRPWPQQPTASGSLLCQSNQGCAPRIPRPQRFRTRVHTCLVACGGSHQPLGKQRHCFVRGSWLLKQFVLRLLTIKGPPSQIASTLVAMSAFTNSLLSRQDPLNDGLTSLCVFQSPGATIC